MCSRIRGDFGRHWIQIAPAPAVTSTSADTTVSTRRGIHHGCGSSPASVRLTTPRRKVSRRGPVHTASPHACMRLRYPAHEGVKPRAAEATPHNPPHTEALEQVIEAQPEEKPLPLPQAPETPPGQGGGRDGSAARVRGQSAGFLRRGQPRRRPRDAQQSGKWLAASGSSTTGGTQLVIWTCHGGANQQWFLH
jgi:Ricin-type beta-trefoil lectin domain-like